jgi:hypothetical protein
MRKYVCRNMAQRSSCQMQYSVWIKGRNLQCVLVGSINFIGGHAAVPCAYIQSGALTVDAMMTCLSTVEACETVQPKEPPHFGAHVVTGLTTHHAYGIARRYCMGSFPTHPSMMSALKANAAHHSLRKTPRLTAFTIDMARDSTIEANFRHGARPRVMARNRTKRAGTRFRFIGTTR